MTDGLGAAARRGVVWSTLAYASTKVLSLVTTAVLARLLVPGDFGVLAAVLVFVAFVELGGDLGMRATVIYEQERGISDRVHVAFTLNLALIGVLTVAALALAPLIAGFFGLEHEVWLFRLGVLALPLRALGNVSDALLLRELAFRRRMIPEIGSSIVKATVSIALALTGAGAEALVIGLLAGTATWSTLQLALTGYRPRLRFDRAVARSMAGYGVGASLLEVAAVIANSVDQIVVGRVLGERALGLYSVAYKIPELGISAVGWNVSQVAFPALSRKRTDDAGDLGRATLKLLRLQALFAVPVATGTAVLAGPLIVNVFGEKWASGAGVLAAAATMAAGQGIAFPIGDLFKAVGRQRRLVMLNVVLLPVLIAGVILAADAGITAIAWTRAAVSVTFAMTVVAMAGRLLAIPPRETLRAAWPAIAAAIGVLAGAGFVRLIWHGDGLGVLLVGAAAAAVGGLLALRLLAGHALGEVIETLRGGRRATYAGQTGVE